MSEFQPGSQPGIQPRRTSDEKQIWWCGRAGQNLLASRQVTIAAAAIDATASPTTTLRAGTIMALRASDGLALPYDPDANDGTQYAVGVLERPQDMLVGGVATNRFTQILVQGMLKEQELHGLDARARQQLAGRFLFDKQLDASAGKLLSPRGVARKSANYALASADSGLLFVATAAVAFTLPSAENGLAFRLLQTADANLTIVGSSNIVCKGNAAASQVAFSTSSEKVGSHVLIECLYTDTNQKKWLVTNLGGTTATVS
jgi:hypothetical protein